MPDGDVEAIPTSPATAAGNRRAAASHDAEFAEFAAASIGRLTQFAELLAGDPHRAADLVQESLERVYLRWHRLDLEDPHAYVRKVIVNQYRNWWTRKRNREVLLPAFPEASSGDDHAARLAQSDLLRRALLTLTVRERTVTVLRFYSDLDVAAIAAELRVPEGTVKSTLSRAMARLRTVPGLADALTEQGK